MRVITPSFEVYNGVWPRIFMDIEEYGRTAYKSEANCTVLGAKKFIKKIIKRGHESVLEHVIITARVICDRGVSHEIVRHRIAAYTQESTRFCDYTKDRFGKGVTFIEPCFWKNSCLKRSIWKTMMWLDEKAYKLLRWLGASPQEARSILPNSLKTEIVITYNLREWRHFFKLRTAKDAHPQMLEIARPLLDYFKSHIPVIFEDIKY